ncbi:MAG: Rieske 2Fe-2S domain-containing protein [Candidatus Marinimicrobia bacterium]|nr:Rieske 2Fe-2S domain-containing protein [Candidatus Neomarinimicrobiota bacterium]MCF7840173.1 Rieske 2Fe-2S domain-containing protein [Candidatus Neomarinimicrobiota bacterium]MCF7902634.1 Rieske 2Fe-2S domain-containing protein [Candidatus Neomarinimicrobiota bacterium]
MTKIGRRDFVNYLLGFGGISAIAAIFYPIGRYLVPPPIREAEPTTLKVGSIDEFPANSSKIVRFGRKPVILIRDSGENIHALTATCTHLDCIVQFSEDRQQIICACHNGVYDLTGKNVSGPPPKPLTEFAVKVIDKEIVISQMKA